MSARSGSSQTLRSSTHPTPHDPDVMWSVTLQCCSLSPPCTSACLAWLWLQAALLQQLSKVRGMHVWKWESGRFLGRRRSASAFGCASLLV